MSSDKQPSIRLDSFLKSRGVVETGGMAKAVIRAGEVTVNGEIETRRRRQLSPGNVVTFADNEITVADDDC